MKSKKTKAIPTKRMRGYEGLTGWMLLVASAPGKKWQPSNPVTAQDAITSYVLLVQTNGRWTKFAGTNFMSRTTFANKHPGPKLKRTPPSPLRLLAPGGIIAAESHTRKDKRSGRRPRKLIDTGTYRHSITKQSLARQDSYLI